MDTFIERAEIAVLRVRADFQGSGPAGAMAHLESKLRSLKGRKLYGVFRELPEGEEYFACVERTPADDPGRLQLEVGAIPGGLYARRKLLGWQKLIESGTLGNQFQEMIRLYDFDPGRPEIEFYRSMTELHLLLPVKSRALSCPS